MTATYTAAMRVDVLLFGPLADSMGEDRVAVECEIAPSAPGPTVAEVLAALAVRNPTFQAALSGARLAVNHAFASPEAVIGPEDEVALIALVGGG